MKLPENWKFKIVTNLDEIDAIRPVWEHIQKQDKNAVINTDIDRYISIIRTESDDNIPYIMILSQNEKPKAMLIGYIKQTHISMNVGYKTVFSPALKCLSIVYNGLPGADSDEICGIIIWKLMNILKEGKADVVKIYHTAADSLLYRALIKKPCFLSRTYKPKKDKHWTKNIPENVDLLYRSFTPKTRNTIKRKIKKLENEFVGHLRIETYCDKERLKEGIAASAEISRCSYQSALNAGIVNDSRTYEILEEAVKHNWLEISVLYIKDEPCAYQIGFLYGNTYLLDQMAFNPAWKQWNIGTFLFMKVLEDLCLNPSINRLDFGIGDAQYKSSYGDNSWDELTMYIFAPRIYPVFVNILRTCIEGMNSALKYAAEKAGFINRIKRGWRDQLARKSSENLKLNEQ